MKNIGVVIDSWKLPIFKKHLEEAGYAFTEHPGLAKETLTLQVQCEWVAELKPIIEAAAKECTDYKSKPR
jgi:hypothetical protein